MSNDVKAEFLISTKTLAQLYIYLDKYTLHQPKIVKPKIEELHLYVKYNCPLEAFPYELKQISCIVDKKTGKEISTGSFLFPLKNGYFLSIGFNS